MRRAVYVVFIVVVSSLLLAGSFESEVGKVREFTLDNGLKVIMYENHQAPVISMVTYVNVGSANERPGLTGISHIFEHMAFKGTHKIGTMDPDAEWKAMEKVDKAFHAWKDEHAKGYRADADKLKALKEELKKAKDAAREYVISNEFNEIAEREGCSGLNAYTSWDNTAYFYNFPSNKLELWAYLESERFLNPRLREFYTEKDGVIMEERRMRTDSSPTGRMIEEFIAMCYVAHPYHHPVVGWASDIQTITREEALEWYDQYYQPNNMVISVAGDIHPDKDFPVIEKYFGRIPGRPAPEPVETVEPPQRGERREVIEDPSQPFVIMGYHKGDFNHPDESVFDAITDIMGAGRTSRLYKRLVRDEKLALAAGAFTGIPGQKFPGLFIFYGLPMQGHTNEEVEQAILEEIEKMKTEPVTDEELERVKTRAKGDFLRQLKSNSGVAHELAAYQTLTGDWREMFKELEEIDRVTREDIMRVAKECFTKNNRTIVYLQPPKEGGES